MRAGSVLIAGCLALAGAARAQTADPADLAFWQSLGNSTNPAEYQAYLQAFPNGKFAPLARLRLNPPAPRPVGTQTAAPTAAAPAPPPPPVITADDDQPAVTVTPASARVGQKFTFGCATIPEGGQFDQLVVVHAGSPVVDPNAGAPAGVLAYAYMTNCLTSATKAVQLGPFPPGQYEARWMTQLYSSEHKYENKASAPFTVR